MKGSHLKNQPKLMNIKFELTDCHELLWELVWSWANFGADGWSSARADLLRRSSEHLISSFQLFLILFSSLVCVREHFALQV
jgi:hypothetical protein